jgi:hypothetical protein
MNAMNHFLKSKSDSEIIEEYIKCFASLHYSYNIPFNDKYRIIDEYEEELLNTHKPNTAKKTQRIN